MGRPTLIEQDRRNMRRLEALHAAVMEGSVITDPPGAGIPLRQLLESVDPSNYVLQTAWITFIGFIIDQTSSLSNTDASSSTAARRTVPVSPYALYSLQNRRQRRDSDRQATSASTTLGQAVMGRAQQQPRPSTSASASSGLPLFRFQVDATGHPVLNPEFRGVGGSGDSSAVAGTSAERARERASGIPDPNAPWRPAEPPSVLSPASPWAGADNQAPSPSRRHRLLDVQDPDELWPWERDDWDDSRPGEGLDWLDMRNEDVDLQWDELGGAEMDRQAGRSAARPDGPISRTSAGAAGRATPGLGASSMTSSRQSVSGARDDNENTNPPPRDNYTPTLRRVRRRLNDSDRNASWASRDSEWELHDFIRNAGSGSRRRRDTRRDGIVFPPVVEDWLGTVLRDAETTDGTAGRGAGGVGRQGLSSSRDEAVPQSGMTSAGQGSGAEMAPQTGDAAQPSQPQLSETAPVSEQAISSTPRPTSPGSQVETAPGDNTSATLEQSTDERPVAPLPRRARPAL